MFRYLIAVGDFTQESHRSELNTLRRRAKIESKTWRVAVDRSNCFAIYADRQYYQGFSVLLTDDSGVIFGSLFRSSKHPHGCGSRPLLALENEECVDIVQSAGRALIENYWGHYVALVRTDTEGRFVVLRSPVSPLPCLHRRSGALDIFFSHLPDALTLLSAPTSINWDCIAAQVVGNDYLSSETGVREILAIECGTAIECGAGAVRTNHYWDPRSFLEKRDIDDFPRAVESIESAVDYCVAALSSNHERILVKLSGGLDSSIVLESLSRASHRPTLRAVNYFSRASGDERVYARCMAQKVAVPLIEREREEDLDLKAFHRCNMTVQPVLNFSAADSEGRNLALAHELGASALFDGELGDNVFGSYPGPGTLVEYGRRGILARGILAAALDYSALTRQSLWRTVKLALRESRDVRRRPDFVASEDLNRRYGRSAARSLFLTSDDVAEHCTRFGDRFVHPWLRRSRGLAPGSQPLIFGLIASTSTALHSPFSLAGDPPRISPLMGQPLAEVSLRIPSYLHIQNGQDRAVARSAYARRIPDMIIQRGLGKGGPTMWTRDLIDKNPTFFREFLRDGILVKRGLIDRRKLDVLLSPGIVKSVAMTGDLIAKAYIEAWLRKWPAA